MVVIISIGKLQNGGIQIAVAKPQHDSKPTQTYSSENEAREVLLAFGVDPGAVDLYLFKLFPQISENQELAFPPMDIPQQALLSRGFSISTSIAQAAPR